MVNKYKFFMITDCTSFKKMNVYFRVDQLNENSEKTYFANTQKFEFNSPKFYKNSVYSVQITDENNKNEIDIVAIKRNNNTINVSFKTETPNFITQEKLISYLIHGFEIYNEDEKAPQSAKLSFVTR